MTDDHETQKDPQERLPVEKPPLTRFQLDRQHCERPGCTHEDHTVLFLTQSCHPGRGVEVSYDQRDGIMTVGCHVCSKMVAQVLVANTH
jgi:hypothetical protein